MGYDTFSHKRGDVWLLEDGRRLVYDSGNGFMRWEWTYSDGSRRGTDYLHGFTKILNAGKAKLIKRGDNRYFTHTDESLKYMESIKRTDINLLDLMELEETRHEDQAH